MLLICGLMMVFLVEGCSSPGEKQVRATAETISTKMDGAIGIDIIAVVMEGGVAAPLTLPNEAGKVSVVYSLEPGKDKAEFSVAISELKRMLRRPSNEICDCVTRLWLRIRFRDDDHAYYCMYDPDDTHFLFTLNGPVDLKAKVSDDEWKSEGVALKSSRKFREILNRHIPSD